MFSFSVDNNSRCNVSSQAPRVSTSQGMLSIDRQSIKSIVRVSRESLRDEQITSR
jgi:hypothetical protein